jgi:flagellar hook-length control protein FliK
VAAATRARVAASTMGEITRLVVHMSPEDLGPVRITAEQTATGVQVDLAGGDETVREALRDALDDLRQQLDAGTSGRRDPREDPRDAGRWAGGTEGEGGRGHRAGPPSPAARSRRPLPRPGQPAPARPVPHRGVDVRA